MKIIYQLVLLENVEKFLEAGWTCGKKEKIIAIGGWPSIYMERKDEPLA
ncbi:MAG: hypothetical protein HY883_02820 [Deltaproteobacteria bacterium]|nr:hypothetical protein [Deltaproteobacteria bacterium]